MSDESPNSEKSTDEGQAAPADPGAQSADQSAQPTPESDDAAIEELERGFTDEEKAAAAAATVVRKTAKAPVKKDAPTRKRSEAERSREEEDRYKARTPMEFARQSAGELKQVTWPTWPELTTYFFAVLIFVLFVITFVGLLDLGFGWGLLQLLGLLGTN